METLVRVHAHKDQNLYRFGLLLILLSLHRQGHSSCIQNFLSATDIETIALENPQQLEVRHREQHIFPTLTFSCYGNITSWRVAAVDTAGGARPEISVWRQNEGNPQQYTKISGQLMDRIVIEQLDGTDIVIIENTATTPLPFQPGDILGLNHRRESVAEFVPYLYRVVTTEGPLNYFSPESNTISSFTQNPTNSDNLLPLVSIEIICTGVTSPDNNSECENISNQTSALPSSMTPPLLPTPLQPTPLLPTPLLITSASSRPLLTSTAQPSNTPTSTAQPSNTATNPSPSSSSSLSTELLIVIVSAGVIMIVIVMIVAIVSAVLCFVSRRKPGVVLKPTEMAMETNLAYGEVSQHGTSSTGIYEQIDDGTYEYMYAAAPASTATLSHNPEGPDCGTETQALSDNYYVNEGMGPPVGGRSVPSN